MGLINTVLGYKKGSKTKNIFSISENMMFELSNALSIVFISLKLVKIRQVKVLSVAPPKGHESLLRNFEFKPANGIFTQKCKFPTFQKVRFLGSDVEH